MKRIVTIGGGTGQYTLLTGLKTIPNLDISAVVTMADSGGSSGVLRTERGALPPGDVLRCLLALATADENVIDLFAHRFVEGGGVGGHTIGNIILTGAAEQQGDFLGGIATVAKMLQPRGRVLPVTLDRVELCALLSDGSNIRGEHLIDRPRHDPALRIESVWLEPHARALPDVIEAMLGADAIIVGPGDLFTSIIPVALVDGVAEALRETRGHIVFIVNTMTKRGETNGFHIDQFVLAFEKAIGRTVHIILCNTRLPPEDILAKYEAEGAHWVQPDIGGVSAHHGWGPREVVSFPLLADGPFARHDPIKLAHVIRALL